MKVYHVTAAESVEGDRHCVFVNCRCQQRSSQHFGILDGQAEDRRENPRLVFAPGVMLIEAVIGQLCALNDRVVPTRKLHALEDNDLRRETADAEIGYYLTFRG